MASTSVTDPITVSTDAGEIGAEQTTADSSNVTEMDTSMQNSAKPKIPPPLPVSNDDVDQEQTGAYSDDGTIPDTNVEPQSPVVNDKIIHTGKDTVENSTDTSHIPEMTGTQTEANRKMLVLNLQPLSDIDIDIWSNKVGHLQGYTRK